MNRKGGFIGKAGANDRFCGFLNGFLFSQAYGAAQVPAACRSCFKVKISTQQINSKVGVCKFLDAKADGNRLNTHVECQFPAGPLMGDITFTRKPNNTIDFVDSDKTYSVTLYRCPN